MNASAEENRKSFWSRLPDRDIPQSGKSFAVCHFRRNSFPRVIVGAETAAFSDCRFLREAMKNSGLEAASHGHDTV
jgi:hypothetical protein